MSFTEQQIQAMEAGVGNVLVSAAAGSGKTRVVIERILRAVMRRENPVDIDRMLIVTFTRNAANELRTRIADAMEKALWDDPDNERLQKQARNAQFAKISTIDSFCQTVVRRYFHKADLDPSFRLLDESEGKALQERALNSVLEKAYETADPEFLSLAAAYGGKTGDSELVERINELAAKCDSDPFPEDWLTDKLALYESASEDGGLFLAEIVENRRAILSAWVRKAERVADACGEPGMPGVYEETLRNDLSVAERVLAAATPQEYLAEVLRMPEWQRLSTKKCDCDPEQKDIVKTIRDGLKAAFKTAADEAAGLAAGTAELQQRCIPQLRCLCGLVREYRREYRALQKEANAYDFSAIAHIALTILLDENRRPTAEAVAMSREFEEIMIDEYQDSNLLQEYLLGAVTHMVDGKPNLFMVGDSKQSIYKFRQARPELFLGKCADFTADPSHGTRIDLQMNFRSNEAVISSVNRVCGRMMQAQVGGIDYDERAQLYYGGGYDTTGECGNPAYRSEYLLIGAAEDAVSAECNAIAKKIAELTDPVTGLTVGKENPHIATYGDIAVLTRSKSAVATRLIGTLRKAGIPVISSDSKGYYDIPEVDAVISMLRLLDNPLQEIPMVTVLTSPVFAFSADELAALRLRAKAQADSGKAPYFYTVMRQLAEGSDYPAEEAGEQATGGDRTDAFPKDTADGVLREKCIRFFEVYDRLRKHTAYLSAAELIEEFFAATRFCELCAAMPGGDTASDNLNQLLVKARNTQATMTGNLRDFLGCVDSVRKWKLTVTDDSSADSTGAVQWMTIHGSKGLEYPIVILADTARAFNTSDTKRELILHDDLGFGPQVYFTEERLKYPTTAKQAIAQKLLRELYGEELRLLYVAMTRAKEKLIVTGSSRSSARSKFRTPFLKDYFYSGEKLSYAELMRGTQNYQYLLLAAVFRDLPEQTVLHLCDAADEGEEALAQTDVWDVRVVKESAALVTGENSPKEDAALPDLSGRIAALREASEYRYAGRNADLPVKLSVSYLKKVAYLEKEAEAEARERADGTRYLTEDWNSQENAEISKAVRQNEEARSAEKQSIDGQSAGKSTEGKPADSACASADNGGADYGTLVHRVLQLHDYRIPCTVAACREELETMAGRRQIAPEDVGKLAPERFTAFYESPLGQRMKCAAESGRLRRERPFVMTIPATMYDANASSEETILLQGVIDAYFEENDGIVLVDYKTDRVPEDGGEAVLLRRYEKQLELYADAITRACGIRVKEKIIYSFALNKSIPIGYNKN